MGAYIATYPSVARPATLIDIVPDKSNIDRASELATQIGSKVRKAGNVVAEEIKKLPVEDVVATAGEVATETGRRVRDVAGRFGREMRKRIKR